jgi:methylated-DNA-[protein]-cysteine S-methyltransferase
MNYHAIVSSPLGQILLTAEAGGLTGIHFMEGTESPKIPSNSKESRTPFTETIQQLQKYFQGRLKTFELPLSPQGTEFQQKVWKTLRRIPYGTTISYGELAKRIGNPSASRAVGRANGCNPLPIVVPCHRVIGANGSLVGYAGGLPIKEYLLNLEAQYAGA